MWGCGGGDFAVQSHSMGGVRGRAENTRAHTHTHRNGHANIAPTLLVTYPYNVPDKRHGKGGPNDLSLSI